MVGMCVCFLGGWGGCIQPCMSVHTPVLHDVWLVYTGWPTVAFDWTRLYGLVGEVGGSYQGGL